MQYIAQKWIVCGKHLCQSAWTNSGNNVSGAKTGGGETLQGRGRGQKWEGEGKIAIIPTYTYINKSVCTTCFIKNLSVQCTPDNGETVKGEFRIKGKVPRERIFYVVNHFG